MLETRPDSSRRVLHALGLAIALLGLSACATVDVQTKPGSGLGRNTSFALAVEDDATATRAKLTSRLIGHGFNVIAALPAISGPDEARDALPSRLRRVSNALPQDAVDTGFASRYVLEVDHAFEETRRFGMSTVKYTRFAARMVDRVTGQVVLSAVLDGGRKVNPTLDDFVEALEGSLD